MLKIVLLSMLAADAKVTYKDGQVVAAHSNYGGVAKGHAHIVGTQWPKNLTFFKDAENFQALYDCEEHWCVLKETYDEKYGVGQDVRFVGTLANCGKYIERQKKPVVADDVFSSFFGAKIIKAKEDKPKGGGTTTSDLTKNQLAQQEEVEDEQPS